MGEPSVAEKSAAQDPDATTAKVEHAAPDQVEGRPRESHILAELERQGAVRSALRLTADALRPA